MLDGRVAIITGAGRGLGRAHALELASHGATVVVNDLAGDGGSPADDVVAEIQAAGGTASADGSSVTDHAAVGAMVDAAVERYGRLDIVVNNAGLLRDGMLVNLDPADWDLVIDVHLKGTFNLVQHAVRHWRAEAKAGRPTAGRIINTTSGTGLFGNVGQSSYGAAKAAVANLTVITAMEVERYGVTVNAVSPIARTRMTEGLPMMDEAVGGGFDRFDAGNASPVVAWLASERSGWLTGAILRIDGDTLVRVQPWDLDRTAVVRPSVGVRLDALALDGLARRAFRVAPAGTPTLDT